VCVCVFVQEAVDVYLEAVNKLPSHYAPQSLYNMLGICATLCLLILLVYSTDSLFSVQFRLLFSLLVLSVFCQFFFADK